MWIHTPPSLSHIYSLLNCSPALAGVTALREVVTPATVVESPPHPFAHVSFPLVQEGNCSS